MAINILYGPGGTGKSYYQMKLIVNELRYTKRNVVTNLAINVPRLCEYLEQQYPTEKIDVLNRIRILDVAETKLFWRHRGPLTYEGINWGDDLPPAESAGKQGVLFVVDEAGAAGFDANGWAQADGRSTRGQDCAWYLDQQRKFGDDVFASQNGRRPAGIAKPFRDKAHSFIRLKNGYLQTYGIFKGRGRFTATHYTHEPDKSSEAIKEESWQMDASGLASCYRTQDGVGVVGVNADIGKKAKGIPILFMIPGMIVVGLLVAVGLPMFLARAAGKVAKKDAKPVPVEVSASTPGRTPDTAAPAAAAPIPVLPAVLVAPIPSHSGVTVTGITRSASKVTVNLSDGRSLTEGESYLRIERTYVESPIGSRYFMARPASFPADRTPKDSAQRPALADANASPVLERNLGKSYSGEALFEPSSTLFSLDLGVVKSDRGVPQGGKGVNSSSTGGENPVAWQGQRPSRR